MFDVGPLGGTIMTENKISCMSVPCTTCPYRRDVPSGVWDASEYEKLPAYDEETWQQPAKLFMCHQQTGGLCTGWLQSHANREHAYDLLALRMYGRELDAKAVSKVVLSEPAVPLFSTGVAAMRHGLKQIHKPGKKAKAAMKRIVTKRKRKR